MTFAGKAIRKPVLLPRQETARPLSGMLKRHVLITSCAPLLSAIMPTANYRLYAHSRF